MVLIIGLINLAGPQTPVAEADTINPDGPRLNSSDGLTVVGVSPTDTNVSVQLNQADADGGTGYDQNVGDYTAMVPFNVNYVTIGMATSSPVTAEVSSHTADADPVTDGHQVSLTAGATTTITVTASGNAASQNYVVKVKRQKAQLTALEVDKGDTTTNNDAAVTLNPVFAAATTAYNANLDYADKQVTIRYIAPQDESADNNGDPERGEYKTTVPVSPDDSGVAADGYQLDLTPGVSKKATVSYSRQIFLGWIRKATAKAGGAVTYTNVNTTTPASDAQNNYTYTLHPGSMSDGWSSVSTMSYTIDFLRAKPALASANGLVLYEGQGAALNNDENRIALASDDHPDANYRGNAGRTYYVFLTGDAKGTATSTQPTSGTSGTDWVACDVPAAFDNNANNNLNDNCAAKNGNAFFTPAANKDTLGFASLVTDYTAEVDFDVATVTLTYTLVNDPTGEIKAELISGETGDPDGVISHLQVALNPGVNTIQLQVSDGLLYTVKVTRATPVLKTAATGLRIATVNVGQPITTEAENLTITGASSPLKYASGVGFSPAITTYTLEVGHEVDSLNVAAEAAFGVARLTKPVDSTTTISPLKSVNVPVSQGSGNVIEIEASDPNYTSKTKYKITVTRKPTPLSDLDLSSGGAAVDLDPDFAMDTMEYDASVSYASESIRVTPSVPSNINNQATVTYYTAGNPKGATTSASYLDVPLMVGDNDIRVEIGIPNNTSTYGLTVDRAEPGPVVQFRLYDADGDEITPPDGTRLPLELVSASRRYELNRDDGFTVDVHSVRVNVWLGTGVDADDVKVSVGRVAIPVDSTARGFGGNDPYHTMELAEGTNSMAFEVEFRQHPDDQSLSGRSVHTLTIAREGNSVPTFRPNHGLGQTLIEMVDNVAVDTSTTVLPHGRGGNGSLSYTLVGKRGSSMPQGLEMHPPVGRSADGWIYGAPNIEPRSAYADHTLVLTVADSDDITGNSDQSSVEFTLRIYRDEEAKRAAKTPATTGPAQLTGIGVYYIDPANDPMTSKTCKGQLAARSGSDQASKDCGMLVPSFDPATMSYTVTIPTDVETVDVHAEAGASTTTVTLRGPGSPNLGAGSGVHDNRHEWNGYRVVNGGAAQTDNIYILTATQGTDSNEYRVIIRRETDTPVKFATADKADLSFRLYEGIKPDGNKMTGSAKIWLPEAMVGSGNGATSSWTYSLDRTDTGDEVEKKNFEGLMLNDALTERRDGGGIRLGGGDDVPMLDSDAQGRRKSDKSGAPGVYTVMDADLNKAASDGDSINVSVTVYRDVSLDYYVVGDTMVDNSLGLDSRKISNAWSAGDLNDDYSDWVYTWDATDESGAILVDAYTFPVSHTATEATLRAVANGKGATVDYLSPADADATQSGHQVALGRGDNVVTVRVSNGDVEATHKINLVRPGLQASSIRVDTDRGATTPAMVDLIKPDGSKGFDRDVYTYTATVESWIETLQIRATAVDPTATVSVNLDAINTATGFAEVRLNDPQGAEGSTTEFRIGITNPTPTDTPGLYLLTVTRKGNNVPTFSATQDDVLVKNGEAMKLVLPKASGGNGTVTHNLTEAELPNGVTYDKSTRTISGTPQLTVDQGYESDFVLTYTAVDSDSDTSAADSDSQTFTLTVTNGDVPAEPAPPGLGPDENYNTLRSLVVSYNRPGKAEMVANLVPEFTSDNSGPYTAIVPHDAENVYVTPSLSDAGAALWIDNISQQNARKVKIESETTILVEHTTHPDLGAMTYTVNLSPTSDSVPSFAGKSIEDMVLLAGEDMGVTQLPMADGGNGTVSYTLKDHGGRDIPRRGIGGIKFDASSQTLSGTPVLNADADKTIYRLSYQATDQDGDASEVLGFMVTVCRSEDMPGCDITGNPGYTPADLVVRRSGSSATLTWTPGDDVTKQLVAAVILNPTTGSLMSTIRPAPAGAEVDGNTRRYVFEDLLDASVGTYIFAVWGYSSSASDSWKDANGNAYLGFAQ